MKIFEAGSTSYHLESIQNNLLCWEVKIEQPTIFS